MMRLREIRGPEAGDPPVAAIAGTGRRKARGKRLAIVTLALVVTAPLVWSPWGLAGIGRGGGPTIRSGGDTLTQPLWSAQTRALSREAGTSFPSSTAPSQHLAGKYLEVTISPSSLSWLRP